MPELPEVEVIARGLDAALGGVKILSVDLRWPGAVAIPAPDSFAARLRGQRIGQVWRRGKFLIADLRGSGHLLAHLRMTGNLYLAPQGQETDPYVRVVFHLDSDCDLHFRDVRKFGRLYLVERLSEVLGRLGPEPLDPELSVERFLAMLRGRRARIKPLLLDQGFIAGLGNIYVDETLFRAGIHPLRASNSLSDAEGRRLYDAMRNVLSDAIERRGTTFRDYRDAAGEPGTNQEFLNVYGRKGESCPACGEPIVRTVVGQRGTYFCLRCQPERTAEQRS